MKKLSNTLIFAFLAVFSALFTFGCASGPTTPGGASTQTTTIYGRVVDEAGLPVPGAVLTGGTGSAISDINGFFIMKNATVPQGRALVIGKKAGYFTAAHAEVPKGNGTRIDLYMMSDAATANVSGTAGGTVNVAGGAMVNFAAGSFTDASGAAYTGSVKVSAHFLDPKNPNFFDFFDGDMMAQKADGSGASLISSGVMRVELKDANGNPIKLDPTKPATLNFPKPADAKAPAMMPLWYFDETLGLWKESGSATLSGGSYTGTVTHFSDFNLDYFDSTGGFNTSGTVSLRIVSGGIPIAGVVISIVGDDGGGKYFVHPGGKTDAEGKITFIRFPANRSVQITVRADKNAGLYYMNNPITVNITPGEVKDLGDVSLDSPPPVGLSGTLLDCNGNKIEGLITISDGTHTSYMYTKTGDFAMQGAPGMILTLDAMDAAGNVATTTTIPALTSGQVTPIGSIKICGTNAINFIDIPMAGGNKEGGTIALSPDGKRLAVWQYSNSQLTVYNTADGTMLSQGTGTGQLYAYSIQFSADGMKVLVAAGSAVLFDVSGLAATQIVSITGGSGGHLYDDASAILATVYSGGIYTLGKYSAVTGNLISKITPGGMSDSSNAFGLISAEEAMVYADQKTAGTARVWSVAGNNELRNFTIDGTSYSFSTSDDGLAAAASNDYKIYSFYDTKTGQKTNALNFGGSTSRYHVTMTKNFVYVPTTITGAGAVSSYKISDGTSTLHLLPSQPMSIAASRNDAALAAAYTGKIRVWKLQ